MGKNSIVEKVAQIDRKEQLINLIRQGIPIRDAAKRLDIEYSTARADFISWYGIKQEEHQHHDLAQDCREEILTLLRLDHDLLRKLAIAATRALEEIADAAEAGEASYMEVSEFDTGTMEALLKQCREHTKLILGMVDATSEASEAHAKRNLQGSGVQSMEELRERLEHSPVLRKMFIESGIRAVLQDGCADPINV